MDCLTKEQRKKCMQNIKSKDTKIEVILRKALWHKGYRYRKNYSGLPGKPDIVLTKQKIVIFCDSEFFHGKDWDTSLHDQILRGNNPEFWKKKIIRNMEHDIEVNCQLRAMGWDVLRFWGKEIEKDTEECVRAIEERIFSKSIENAIEVAPIDDSDL